MQYFGGFDLVGTGWRRFKSGALVGSGSTWADDDTDTSASRTAVSLFAGVNAAALWTPELGYEAHEPLGENIAVASFLMNQGLLRNWILQRAEEMDRCAVCHPYHLGAIGRRALKEKCLRGVEVDVVCAPVAAVLELSATDKLRPGADVLLFSGARDCFEAVLFHVRNRDGRFQIDVLWARELASPVSSTLAQDDLAAVGNAIHRSSDRETLIPVVVGNDFAEVARAVREELSLRQSVHVGDEFLLAAGAARFAASLDKQAVRVAHVLPNPVGVLGVNRKGEGFWRQAFPPPNLSGEPQLDPACERIVCGSADAVPSALVFCECIRPKDPCPPWLSLGRDGASAPLLRVFSSVAVEQTNAAPTDSQCRLEIRLRNRSGEEARSDFQLRAQLTPHEPAPCAGQPRAAQS